MSQVIERSESEQEDEVIAELDHLYEEHEFYNKNFAELRVKRTVLILR